MRSWVAVLALSSGCVVPVDVYLGRDLPVVRPVDRPDVDLDADGFTVDEGDCDDLDAAVGPGRWDGCDGKDNDCDGVVDGGSACASEDSFVQSMTTDVLIVLDNSYDMSTYWSRASLGAAAMAEHLVGPGSDTRIAVLFNDMETQRYKGKLVEPRDYPGLWLEGDDPRLTAANVQAFFDQTLVYQQAEGPEGRYGIRWAVERAIAIQKGEGFFRTDASLNLVLITNQDDFPSPDNSEFIDTLLTSEGSLSEVHVYAVTQTDTFNCLAPYTPAEPAGSILDLVDLTGGFSESVCRLDWTGFLSSVGQAIAGDALRHTFTLSEPAKLEGLTVTVDPIDGPPYPWDDWSLQDEYTLVFPDAAPPLGSTITVDYVHDWRH